jgi:regulator of replication initiation timing
MNAPLRKERFAEDWPIMSIYRRYSKDEATKALFDEIASLKFQIGELKSENEELKHNLAEATKITKKVKVKPLKEAQKESWYNEVARIHNEQIKKKGDKIKKLEDDLLFWRNKATNLIAKYESGK